MKRLLFAVVCLVVVLQSQAQEIDTQASDHQVYQEVKSLKEQVRQEAQGYLSRSIAATGAGSRSQRAASQRVASFNDPIDLIYYTSEGTLLLASGGILTRLPEGEPPENLALVLTAFVDVARQEGDLLFAEGVSGVFRSEDDGLTWQQVFDEITVSLSSSDELIVAGGLLGEVWVSEDSGDSWSITNAADTADVFFTSKIAALGDVVVYGPFIDPLRTSGDRGTTWEETPATGAFLWSNQGHIFTDHVDGDPTITISTDGKTWSDHAGHQIGLVFDYYEDERVRVIADGDNLQFQRPGEGWRFFDLGGEEVNTFAIAPDGRLLWGTEEGSLSRSANPIVAIEPPPPAPMGTLDPVSISIVLMSQDAVTAPITITNTGQVELSFQASSQASFVSVNPDSGTVVVSGSQVVEVTADPTGLPSGVYQANIDIILADSALTVPLTFEIPSFTSTDHPPDVPATHLGQPYPNPFLERLTIPFTVNEPGYATMEVFDVTGRKVATLRNQHVATGDHAAHWSPQLPAGVYLVRLRVGEHTSEQLVTLRK